MFIDKMIAIHTTPSGSHNTMDYLCYKHQIPSGLELLKKAVSQRIFENNHQRKSAESAGKFSPADYADERRSDHIKYPPIFIIFTWVNFHWELRVNLQRN